MPTQTTILAQGVTIGATSSAVTLESGASAIVSIYTDGNNLPRDCIYDIYFATPGDLEYKGRISGEGDSEVRLDGPGVWYFKRSAAGSEGLDSGLTLVV